MFSRTSLDGTLKGHYLVEIHLVAVLRYIFTTGDAQDSHAFIIPQTGQELGRDQEVLTRVFAAGDLNHALVDHTLVARVHALVDLVHDAERGLCHRLQRHEVEDSGYSTLATGLAVLVQLYECLVLTGMC